MMGMQVFERGWLSSNGILLMDAERAACIDSGYCTHAQQTLALMQEALAGRELDLLLNTHLHSDHCGGNATLQAQFPRMRTLIPPGHAAHVRDWDPEALSYGPTGQQCQRFRADGVLEPGSSLSLGGGTWEVHAAPGHDAHSIILFEPASRTLLSADALWRNGFGVIFQELEGEHAFADVAATLDLIESLRPALVVPGHGPVFTDAADALKLARGRLEAYVRDPRKHAAHGAKVLLKFKLLELQRVPLNEFKRWLLRTPYFTIVHERYFSDRPIEAWLEELLNELQRSKALVREAGQLLNA